MGIKKYLKLLWVFGKLNLQNQLAYRPSFYLAVIGKTLRMLLLIFTFRILYIHTPFLAGWSYPDVFLLTTTYLTVETLLAGTFHRNLSYYFPDLLRKGTFDFLLTKPVNTLFFTSFRIIDFMDLASGTFVLILWYHYLTRFAPSITVSSILLYLLFFLFALVFLYSFLLIIASTAFWTINATGLGRFFEDLTRVARFPSDVFQGIPRLIIQFIFPIGIVATVPSQILLGVVQWPYLVYLTIFTVLLFLTSQQIWRFALKHYSSASS